MKLRLATPEILGFCVGSRLDVVLGVVQRKINRCAYSGFNRATLKARNELLLFLYDDYAENEGNNMDQYKDDSSFRPFAQREILIKEEWQPAALLLVLESGDSRSCLHYAEALRNELDLKTSNINSTAKELELLLDYATDEYSDELIRRRCYDSSSLVLEKRLAGKKGPLTDPLLKEKLKQKLENIIPFQVLDLLSRNIEDKSREKGIERLKTIINRRGGLDQCTDEVMKDNEFKAFVRQIRKYLTVQEQIDFFAKQRDEGSQVGSFLLSLALVASGFKQRKPERLDQALEMMESFEGVEFKPIIANLNLLLGDIVGAKVLFEKYADQELKDWAGYRKEESLVGLCKWCCEWLEYYVLPGYRDLQDVGDIDAYFSDKEVVFYLENRGKTESQIRESNILANTITSDISRKEDEFTTHKSRGLQAPSIKEKVNVGKYLAGTSDKVKQIGTLVVIFFSVFGLAYAIVLHNDKLTYGDRKEGSVIKGNSNNEKFTSQGEFSMMELRRILESWYDLKRQLLEGGEMPTNAGSIASEKALKQIRLRAKDNNSLGLREDVLTILKNVKIASRSNAELKVDAVLIYEDRTVNREGKILRTTPRSILKRRYTLVKRDGKWVIDSVNTFH